MWSIKYRSYIELEYRLRELSLVLRKMHFKLKKEFSNETRINCPSSFQVLYIV